MAYTPPNTFTPGTTLLSSEVQQNQDDLRIYLHNGISASDVENVQWIDTRHVQPPLYEPYSGVQHGVTGHQGGQDYSDAVRMNFCTRFLTGNGYPDAANDWRRLPNTTFQIQIRRAATVAYHFWWELEAGADGSLDSRLPALGSRYVYIAPYVGNPSLKQLVAAQEVHNNPNGLNASIPYGPLRPHPFSASAHQTSGTTITNASIGTTTVGLAFYSQIDRVAVLRWGVAIEAFYL